MSDYQTSGRDEFLRQQKAQHERTLERIWGQRPGLSPEAAKLAKQRDAQRREQRSGGGERTPSLSLSEQALQRRVAAEVADPNSGKHVAYERYNRMFGGR